MAHDVFVDTSGFFAILAEGDDQHAAALRVLRSAQRNKRGFVTTDYVIDETATLLKARGRSHQLQPFFQTLESSFACRIEWTDADRFHDVQQYFIKHADQAWSFTDCLSFRVMTRLRLSDALTKDAHFQQAGFKPLLK